MLRPKPPTPDISRVLDHYGVAAIGKKVVLCPIHSDTTPSCSVNYQRNLWQCFACGEAGDSWSLIMKKEGVNFGGAIDFATAYGLTDGAAGSGGVEVRGSRYATGGGVSNRQGNRTGGRAYTPSWRRR